MPAWQNDFANAPPYAHLAPWLANFRGPDWPDLTALNDLAEHQNLLNAAGLPLRFAVQTKRCSQYDYEADIDATGQVPSREHNWHDLFNALTWLAFPQAKAVLNALHATTLQQGRNRSPASDAATLFDESGLVLASDHAGLIQLLLERRWHEALVARRTEWRQVRAIVFGHAVLEKLLSPWPGITAKCLFIRTPAAGSLVTLDTTIANLWRSDANLAPASLFPMPVLGIPGWWPANETAAFYADKQIFRPLR